MKEKRKKQNKTKQSKKKTRRTEAIAKGWKINNFVEHLGFLQLIYKVSLISKSNLVEWRCLKIWDLSSFLICYSIPVLKWRQFLTIYLELQLAQVNLYTRKNLKSSESGYLYEKRFLILNEAKTSLMLTFSLQISLQSFESLFLIWRDRMSVYGNLK